MADLKPAFVPCPLERIPSSALQEYRAIYDDLRYAIAGRAPPPPPSASDDTPAPAAGDAAAAADAGDAGPPLPPLAVRAALHVSGVKYADESLGALLAAMTDAAGGARGGGGTGIPFVRFAGCLHALALQDHEVLPAWHYAVFPDSDFTSETATGLLLCRRRVHRLLEEPASSRGATLVALLMVAAILLSTLSFVLESYPQLKGADTGDAFGVVEVLCVALFTAEYALRLACTPERLARWCRRFLNLVDLASILPFYVEQLALAVAPRAGAYNSTGTGASVLRAIRLFRVFRLMKIGQYMTWMRLFGRTLREAAVALGLMALIASLSVLTAASLLYFAERGVWAPGERAFVMPNGSTWFTSIPDAMWWAVVTMTGVGYGDTYPVTPLGKLGAVGAFLAGMLLFAIPISVISGAFHAEFGRMEALKRLRAEHAAQAGGGGPGGALGGGGSGVPGLEQDPALAGGAGEDEADEPRPQQQQRPAGGGAGGSDAAAAGEAADEDTGVDAGSRLAAGPGPRVLFGASLAAPAGVVVDAPAPHEEALAHDAGLAPSSAAVLDAAAHESLLQPPGGGHLGPAAGQRMEERWSEPFLTSVLRLVRLNRRRLMSSMKQAELRNREDAVLDVRSFLADIPARERARQAVARVGEPSQAASPAWFAPQPLAPPSAQAAAVVRLAALLDRAVRTEVTHDVASEDAEVSEQYVARRRHTGFAALA